MERNQWGRRPGPRATPRRRWRGATAAAVLLASVVAWQIVVMVTGVRPRILPSPARIATAAMADLPKLGRAAGITATESIAGLVLGTLVGVLVAYCLFAWSAVERAVYPLLVLSQAVPLIAIAPLVIIWFGFEMGSKVLVVTLYAVFPIAVALLRGLKEVPGSQISAMRTLGAGDAWILLRVRTPHAATHFFSGLRIAATYAPATAATAEFLGARAGLGVYLLSAQASFRTDLVFAAAAVLTLLTLVLFGLVAAVEWLSAPRRFRRGRRAAASSPSAQRPSMPTAVHAPAVGVAGLVRTFDSGRSRVVALDGLSFGIGSGELVALVGPSGCGKTTLLTILAGLDEPSAGGVRIDGSPVASLSGVAAYMPQQDSLLPWRTAAGNVAVAMELAGIRPGTAYGAAERALAAFGLGEFADALPGELSGGMRSRVAFIRTAITRRGLLLLDEPFAALDAITRADLQAWLSSASIGRTAVLVTHDIAEAVFLADRVIVLSPRPGRIVGEVPVSLDRPRPAAVRGDERFFRLCAEVSALLQPASGAATSTPMEGIPMERTTT